LYVILEYPHDDVFKRWSKYVDDEKHPKLKKGIPCEHVVLRNGGLGYSLSVWDEDARLFMTDTVEDNLKGTPREGQGMGLMLQLGPKWLIRFGDILDTPRFIDNIHGQLMLFGLKTPEAYPIRLNRVDIALDVLGMDLNDFSIDEWRHGTCRR